MALLINPNPVKEQEQILSKPVFGAVLYLEWSETATQGKVLFKYLKAVFENRPHAFPIKAYTMAEETI